MLRVVTATRYVAPLREGGSLPGIVEADDLGMYVVKFRGAGQGRKALLAEQIVGELARRAGLNVPDIVGVDLDPAIARHEPDEEIQDLLAASTGLNVGLDYLPGSIGYDSSSFGVGARDAARVLWFDALTLNVDRVWRNPNLLVWGRRLWLIDHGAALYVHHDWPRAAQRPGRPLVRADEHVLLPVAADVRTVDDELAALVDVPAVRAVLADVPDEWLAGEPGFAGPDDVRAAYQRWFADRLAHRSTWVPALAETQSTHGRARGA